MHLRATTEHYQDDTGHYVTVIRPEGTDYDRIVLREANPTEANNRYTTVASTTEGGQERFALRETGQGFVGIEPTDEGVSRSDLPDAVAGALQHLGYTIQESPATLATGGAPADTGTAGSDDATAEASAHDPSADLTAAAICEAFTDLTGLIPDEATAAETGPAEIEPDTAHVSALTYCYLGGMGDVTARERLIEFFLFDAPEMPLPKTAIAEQAGVSRNTVLRHIDHLVEVGLVDAEGEERPRYTTSDGPVPRVFRAAHEMLLQFGVGTQVRDAEAAKR